ncbi:MAG: DUF4372 domain-containing protein [Methylotenera sp.]|nr:DUF4372 domain-containing protein [Methylotenera sp.]
MSHHNTILTQMLKLTPRHEFDSLSQQHDGKRRLGALSRWSQFVVMFTCQVSGLSINLRTSGIANPSRFVVTLAVSESTWVKCVVYLQTGVLSYGL